MKLFSLIRPGLSRRLHAQRKGNSTVRRSPAKPWVEILEDRFVPSTLTVTSDADSGHAGSLAQ